MDATAVACIPHAVPGAAIVTVGGLAYPEPASVIIIFWSYWYWGPKITFWPSNGLTISIFAVPPET